MRTLTEIGIKKISQRLIDTVDHAAYTLDGDPKTIDLFRTKVDGTSAKMYVYFDDTVVGTIDNVQIIDNDGDIIAEAKERSFVKTQGKGLYIAFKYDVSEMEVADNESI